MAGIRMSNRKAAADGAELDTGVLDVSIADTVTVYVDNSAGAGARDVAISLLTDGGAGEVFATTVTVGAGKRVPIVIDPLATSAGDVVGIAVKPAPCLQVVAAAAGADALEVTIYGR